MEKSEQRILAAQIKGRIEEFEHKNECFTKGAIAGMLWCLYLIEHDKEYADRRVKALNEYEVPEAPEAYETRGD